MTLPIYDLVYLDAETYYDSEYSLSKMTTTEYIVDPRFEAICFSLAINDGPVVNYVGEAQIKDAFSKIDWSRSIVVGHNNFFDASILYRHYGIVPAGVLCTMSMAQAAGVVSLTGSASLDNVSKFFISQGYKLPNKGTEVVKALGKRLQHFTPAELNAYRQYCSTDVSICRSIYKLLSAILPPQELQFHDLILKCGTQPSVLLDTEVLRVDLERVVARKRQLLDEYIAQSGGDMATAISNLLSNDKFATTLRNLGGVTQEEAELGTPYEFIIPQKISPRTGKLTWAFAKTDEGVQELSEYGTIEVQTLIEARFGTKSTIQETRLNKFLSLAKCGAMSLPYKISGAHTHRLSASRGEAVNVQNLPSGRIAGQSKALRKALIAPDGYVVGVADSAQIEYRILAFMANNTKALDSLARGIDPYSYQASVSFGGDPLEIKRLSDAGVSPYSDVQRPMGKAQALGLGYGMGANKFIIAARALAGLVITADASRDAVADYRQRNPEVTLFWAKCDAVLREMIQGRSGSFGGPNEDLFFYDGTRKLFGVPCPGIRLPDGMWINYPNLRIISDQYNRTQVVYDKVIRGLPIPYNNNVAQLAEHLKVKVKRFATVAPSELMKMIQARSIRDGVDSHTAACRVGSAVETKYLWGGTLTENLCQGLAFAVIKYQGILLSRRVRVVLNTHDEWGCLLPEGQKDELFEYMKDCLRTTPPYLKGLALKCSGGYHKSYGECEK